ncbi:MAG: hypothetical protein K940chlam2_01271 [Chlamydiae bacterium]|nr:hypothetical protein [Chlamydiota bacterium]
MRNFIYLFILANAFLNANCVDTPEELEQWVASFPTQDYIICDIPHQGRFYVEPYRHDTIKNVLRAGQQWEPYILDIISQYAIPGTVVLDIGSHIGTFTIPMSHTVGESGTVYAFEPQRKLYRELRKNCELNDAQNVVCHQIAIGDQAQIVEMDIETYPGSEGSTSIGQGGDIAEMRTIDSFHLTNVSFVKIDVERTEEQVLDGMVDTILQNKPVIIIELQGGYLWETAPLEIRQKMTNSIKKLETLGYTVSRLYQHDYLALPL